MSGTKDLKDLLDRLKGEIGPLPEIEAPRAAAVQRALQPGAGRQERFNRPDRAQERRAPSGGPQRPVCNENKESMLFGMLASLTAALGGILAGLDYLALIGSLFFSFFSLVMLLALFRFYLNSRRADGEVPGLSERVDALSKKVEMLSSRAVSGGGGLFSAGSPDRERELEQKVEELRVLVKTLAKAVERER
ncbi:MAG: hypothetical protein AAB359_05575 [Elusimicrobiota bacterium]